MKNVFIVVLLILLGTIFYYAFTQQSGDEKKQLITNTYLATSGQVEGIDVEKNNGTGDLQDNGSVLQAFLQELDTYNTPLLIVTGAASTVYLGNASSGGELLVNSDGGVDMYTYFLEETDYTAPVALWGSGYKQTNFYAVMKEKGIAAASGCTLDQDGFEVPTAEYQKQIDDYWERFEESKKLGKEFIDDGSVDVRRCGNINVFCTAQGCGWVFNVKTGGGGHGFIVRQESLVVH